MVTLVNVHIHQFQPGGAVLDAAALAQFQQQWGPTASWSKAIAQVGGRRDPAANAQQGFHAAPSAS
jgi:hypothetical protein